MSERKSAIERFCFLDKLILIQKFVVIDVAIAILLFGNFTIYQFKGKGDNGIGRNNIVSHHY